MTNIYLTLLVHVLTRVRTLKRRQQQIRTESPRGLHKSRGRGIAEVLKESGVLILSNWEGMCNIVAMETANWCTSRLLGLD